MPPCTHEVPDGELCEADGECGTDIHANNCEYDGRGHNDDLYRKYTCDPFAPVRCHQCAAGAACGICLIAVGYDDCPDGTYDQIEAALPSCDDAALAEGGLCEGDGECGTNTRLDNCGQLGGEHDHGNGWGGGGGVTAAVVVLLLLAALAGLLGLVWFKQEDPRVKPHVEAARHGWRRLADSPQAFAFRRLYRRATGAVAGAAGAVAGAAPRARTNPGAATSATAGGGGGGGGGGGHAFEARTGLAGADSASANHAVPTTALEPLSATVVRPPPLGAVASAIPSLDPTPLRTADHLPPLDLAPAPNAADSAHEAGRPQPGPD